jgi:hypothetical protein
VAFCSSCGAPLPDDARFCERCGAEREAASAPAPGSGAGAREDVTGDGEAEPAGERGSKAEAPGAAGGPDAGPPHLSRRPRRKKPIAAIGAAAAVVVIAAALLVFLVPRHFGEGASQRAAQESIEAFVGKKVDIAYQARQPYLGGELMRFSRKVDGRHVDYYVDSATKRVMRMDDFDRSSYEVKLDLAAAQQIAQKYARLHFADFATAGLELTDMSLIDHGEGTAKYYSFTWMKNAADSGALLPVAVTVRVDPVSGDVFSYDSVSAEVTIATSPQVSDAAAGEKALAAVGDSVPQPRIESSTLAVSTDPPDDPAGHQALVWQIVIAGDDSQGYATGASVYIDALSGKVLAVDPFS